MSIWLTRTWPTLVMVLTLSTTVATGADSTYLGHRYLPSDIYTVNDTLTRGVVWAIAPDAQGHLWLATTSGLVRFDGTSFSSWNALGGTVLAGGMITGLMTARDGHLWFGTSTAVGRIVDGRIETFNQAHGLGGGRVAGLLEDRSGTIWVAGRSGLAWLKDKRWTYVSMGGSTDGGQAYALHEARDGALWVASDSGLFRRRAGSETFERLCRDPVSDVAEDLDTGMWWLGLDGIVSHVSACARATPGSSAGSTTPNAQLVRGRRDSRARSAKRDLYGGRLFRDRNGQIWASTEAGLFRSTRLSGTTATMTRVEAQGLGASRVLDFYDDGEGNLWLGTEHGLIRLFHPSVRTLGAADGSRLPTSAVAVTKSGAIWAGTTRGLYRMIPRAAEMALQPSSLTEPIATLHADAADRLWVATSTGVGTYTDDQFRLLPGLGIGNVFSMAVDRDDALWFCHGGSAQLFRWRNGAVAPVDLGPEFNRKVCAMVGASPAGGVWVVFADGTIGIAAASPGRPFRHVATSASWVCGIREDEDGTVWVSNQAGVQRLRAGVAATAGVSNGLPGWRFAISMQDGAGNVWVGTADGVVALAATELDKIEKNALARIHYRVYDASDGLAAAPTCIPSAAARDAQGRVWFATPSGPSVIDPATAAPSTPAVRTRIARLVVNGEPVPLGPSITTIGPKPSTVQFDYDATSLSARSKVRFRYKLDGVNSDWVDAGTWRAAYYTTLPPGTYRFHVRAEIGSAEAAASAVDVRVAPAFHQTATFFGLCLAGAAATAGGVARVRSRANRRRFHAVLEERSRIAREIHDTVLQGMAGAALEIEGLALDAEEPTSGELRRIRERLEDRLMDARRSILGLRTGTTTRQSLPELLQARGSALAHGTAAIHVTVVGTPRHLALADEQLLRIGEEAITNALRHGHASHIEVTVTYERDSIHLSVADNGSGLSAEPPRSEADASHWGIRGMQERALSLGGSLRVLPGHGAGTVVDAVIPLRGLDGSVA